MKFNIKYFIIFVILFLIEVIIERYTTGFIRYTFGDYLVVILLYALIKSIIKITNTKAAIIVLILAYIIEFIQLTNFKNLYPTEYSRVLKLVLGTSFSIGDLIAYTLGILTVLLIENKMIKSYQP